MAVQSSSNNGAVHPLVRLSSQGDYAIVDQQAALVLWATHDDSPHHHGNRLFEFYQTTKRKAVTVLNGQRHCCTAPAVASDPYDTSDWEGPDDSSEYIVAQTIANSIRGQLVCWYHQIKDNSPYRVIKYRIVESTSDGQSVRNYFLQIHIGAPTLDHVFVQVLASDGLGGNFEIVKDYLNPKPTVPLQSCT